MRVTEPALMQTGAVAARHERHALGTAELNDLLYF